MLQVAVAAWVAVPALMAEPFLQTLRFFFLQV